MASSTTGEFFPRSAANADRAPQRVRFADLVRRVKNEVKRDQLSNVAAGVAFFAMLAIFPGLIALVAIYGLLFDPVDVQRQVASLSSMMPASAHEVLAGRLQALVSTPPSQLSIGLIVSLLITLWTASSGTKALIDAVNLAYDEPETRSFFRLRGLAIVMALALMTFVLVAVALVALLPPVLDYLGFGGIGRELIAIVRWPALALAALFGLSALYYYAPARRRQPRRWITAGAVVATAVWVAASLLFSLYVSNFGRYGEVYGALGGPIVLMLWLFVSALCVLFGAEVDSEIQAARLGRPARRA